MTGPSTPQPLWDVKQAATRCALSEAYIYRLVAERRIPFVKIGGALRFKPAEIESWLEAKSTPVVK